MVEDPGKLVTYDQFTDVEIRVGKIVRAEPFSKARKPAFKLWIDFGEYGVRRSSAQLTTLYRAEDLPGRQVLAVTNFPPRQVADLMSEVLVLGAMLSDEAVVLVQPERDVPPGSRIL